MELRTKFLHRRHSGDDLIVQHIRVKAAQADALDAFDLGGFLDQLHQAGAAVSAVAGQADGRQHHLFIPGSSQAAQFLQDAFFVAAAHRAAGTWDDAVGALAVAAILDLDKGTGVFGELIHGQFFKLFALPVGADVHHPLVLAVQHAGHIGQNGMAVAGAGHHVGFLDLGGLLGKGLRVAARQHRNGTGILALGTAQPFAAFLVAEIGHGAAVDNVHVGRLLVGDDRIAVFLKQLCQGAGLILVHLAAQSIKSNPHSFCVPRFPVIFFYYKGKAAKAQY